MYIYTRDIYAMFVQGIRSKRPGSDVRRVAAKSVHPRVDIGYLVSSESLARQLINLSIRLPPFPCPAV